MSRTGEVKGRCFCSEAIAPDWIFFWTHSADFQVLQILSHNTSVQTGHFPELGKKKSSCYWLLGNELDGSPLLEIGSDCGSGPIANRVLTKLFKHWLEYEYPKSLPSHLSCENFFSCAQGDSKPARGIEMSPFAPQLVLQRTRRNNTMDCSMSLAND